MGRKGSSKKITFVDDEVEAQILSIIRNAIRNVILVTPYLALWGHLQNTIDEAVSRGVVVSFIIRTKEKPPIEDMGWLVDHKVKLYEIPDLHAKIYINESTVLISSMNITEHSTTNSLEFAMIVESRKDATRFRNYVSDMLKRAEVVQLAEPEGQEVEQTGRCIRCGRQIDFNVSRPLCDSCYQSWAVYANTDYPERHCHSCGKPSQVTYARPLCGDCYNRR